MSPFWSSVNSALGGAAATFLITVLSFVYVRSKTALLSYAKSNLEGMKTEVHIEYFEFTEPQDQIGISSPNEPQPTIVFRIINHSGSPVFIAAAAFRATSRKFGLIRRRGVDVQSGYKSTRFSNALELKFGENNRTPYCLIPPGEHEETWLRLMAEPNANMIQGRLCGEVLIKYATESRSGTHVEAV